MADAMQESAYRTDALIAEDIDAYLAQHQHKTLLRFITCGSVDDGKSTLIGRLLYDSKMIFEDQLAALEADSKRVGTQGQEIDFALLVDGLAAEREQGITIDVAYRFFATSTRKFIVADTPGHEQYTRNMVTGASTADLAVILIDARKGVLTQTRRHSYLAHLIGIRNLVLAVNKMDLIGYDEARYDAIVADYAAFAASIGIAAFTPMPISGFKGDNITSPSANTPWYDGPALMAHLETVDLDVAADQAKPFRMPVQWVNRPNLDFRGFSGLIASGTVAPGDAVRILPSGKTSTVARIVTLPAPAQAGGDLDAAAAGQSVTLTLADEIDCSRGDVICVADDPPQAADQFEATIVWMADEAMLPGRPYWLKLATQTVTATVQQPKYQVNVNTMEHLAARTLELNAIGVANLAALVQPGGRRHARPPHLPERTCRPRAGAGPLCVRPGVAEGIERMNGKTVVVFGASSRQGQAQVAEALAAGHRVRAVTRTPGIFAGSADVALEVVAADYLDPSSLDAVCRRAAVLFFQPPQFGGPETIHRQVDNVAAAAKRADVGLVVYNSTMWAPDEPCGEPGYDNVLALEDLFVGHGSPVVVFRPVLFMDNLQTLFAKPALVGEGVYRYCHRPGLTATWISLEDVAKFMVAAIDRPDLVGERLVIGGPERLAIEEVLSILSPLIGRPIRHEFVEPRAFGAALAEALGMPGGPERDGFIDYFDSFYTFNNYSPRTPFEAREMDSVLKRLPVAMKPFRQWAAEQDWSAASLEQGDKTLVGSVSG